MPNDNIAWSSPSLLLKAEKEGEGKKAGTDRGRREKKDKVRKDDHQASLLALVSLAQGRAIW